MSFVEQSMKEHEEGLLEFIEDKVIERLQLFCQWRLTLDIEEIEQDKEAKRLNEYSYEVIAKIKEIAPLHGEMMQFCPFSTVFNDACWRYEQYQYAEYQREYEKDGFCFWRTITYNEFEEAGFSKDFAKRTIEEFVERKLIKRFRGIWGYSYALYDFKDIVDEITHSRESVSLTQSWFEVSDRFKWIFDKYSDEQLEDVFAPIRNKIIEKIGEGYQFKDLPIKEAL